MHMQVKDGLPSLSSGVSGSRRLDTVRVDLPDISASWDMENFMMMP